MHAGGARLRAGLLGLGLTLACVVAASFAFPRADGHADSTSNVEPAAWSEEPWPFPIDQWGKGRAFRCGTGACGGELHVYLRAKIGFCRCATGVSDDDEIDRVGDAELFGTNYKPLAAGQPVKAGMLAGRSRLFAVERPLRSSVLVLTVALAHRCDAIVGSVAAGSKLSSAQQAAALDFLRSETVQRWAEMSAGSE